MTTPDIVAALLGKRQEDYEDERASYVHDLAVEKNEADQESAEEE